MSSCSICTSVLAYPLILRALPCGHVFCQTCLFQWLSSRSQCPLCRQPATQRDAWIVHERVVQNVTRAKQMIEDEEKDEDKRGTLSFSRCEERTSGGEEEKVVKEGEDNESETEREREEEEEMDEWLKMASNEECRADEKGGEMRGTRNIVESLMFHYKEEQMRARYEEGRARRDEMRRNVETLRAELNALIEKCTNGRHQVENMKEKLSTLVDEEKQYKCALKARQHEHHKLKTEARILHRKLAMANTWLQCQKKWDQEAVVVDPLLLSYSLPDSEDRTFTTISSKSHDDIREDENDSVLGLLSEYEMYDAWLHHQIEVHRPPHNEKLEQLKRQQRDASSQLARTNLDVAQREIEVQNSTASINLLRLQLSLLQQKNNSNVTHAPDARVSSSTSKNTSSASLLRLPLASDSLPHPVTADEAGASSAHVKKAFTIEYTRQPLNTVTRDQWYKQTAKAGNGKAVEQNLKRARVGS